MCFIVKLKQAILVFSQGVQGLIRGKDESADVKRSSCSTNI